MGSDRLTYSQKAEGDVFMRFARARGAAEADFFC